MDTNNIGKINISEDVIAIIASLAAEEVNKVSQLQSSLTDMIGKKNLSKGVKVKIEDEKVNVDIQVNVYFGTNIPKVAVTIQNNIKNMIENMTSMQVHFVNVYIQNIIESPEKLELHQ